MKMMGLEDTTYYLGWFILFLIIATYNALVFTIIVSIYFDKINPFIMFSFLMLYSFSIFGSAWIMVAILPSTTGAIILAIVWHFLTFNVSQTFQTGNPSASLLYSLSFFSNIAMGQVMH